MRIIAGEFRRRRLKANPGQTTRPITDRAKESLFARIEPLLEERNIADIFSGTGSLGLEALSRGAAGATFFERDPLAVKLLGENIATLGLDECTLVWPTDIFRTSFRPRGVPGLLPWSLVFFDPPYRMVETIRPGRPLYKSLARLAASGSVEAGGRLIFRMPSRTTAELPPAWQVDEELDQSVAGMPRSMALRVYRLADDAGDAPPAAASRDEVASDDVASDDVASDDRR